MIAVIADTHMPRGKIALPEVLEVEVEGRTLAVTSMGILHPEGPGLRFEHLWLG